MDALSKQMKTMVETAIARCEAATEAELIAWASADTLQAVFAQHELKYRDMDRAPSSTRRWRGVPND